MVISGDFLLRSGDRKESSKSGELTGMYELDMNTEFLKLRIIYSCKRSVVICISSVYFTAPHSRLVPPHFVCSVDGTALRHRLINNTQK